jgi:hypothetical protein
MMSFSILVGCKSNFVVIGLMSLHFPCENLNNKYIQPCQDGKET